MSLEVPRRERHPRVAGWKEFHLAHERGDRIEALRIAKALAATCDPLAPVEIAALYEVGGGGVLPDFVAALQWYMRAADLGDAKANLALGRLYYLGTGVEIDHPRAFEFFSKSARANERGAFFALGIMSEFGKGTELNPSAAIDYYRRAVALGHVLARKHLGAMLMRSGKIAAGSTDFVIACAQLICISLRNTEDPRLRIA